MVFCSDSKLSLNTSTHDLPVFHQMPLPGANHIQTCPTVARSASCDIINRFSPTVAKTGESGSKFGRSAPGAAHFLMHVPPPAA